MLPFPKLDRPTVVGEEGRPRTVSLTIAGLIVLGLSVGGGAFMGNSQLVFGAGLFTASLVMGLALQDRDRFGSLVVGTLLTIPFSTVLIGWMFQQSIVNSSVLVLLGITVALLGLGLTWVDLDGKDDVEEVIDRIAVSYGGSVLGGFIPLVLYGVFRLVVDLAGGNGIGSMFAFPVGVAVLWGSVYVATRALPFAQLTTRSRRQEMAERVARARRLSAIGAAVSICVTIALPFAGTIVGLYSFLRFLSFQPLVWLVALVSGGLLCLSGIAWLARRATRDRNAAAQRRVAGMVAGALVALFLLALPIPVSLLALGILLLLVGPILFIVAAVLFGISMGVGLAPERLGGLGLASGGLGLVTVGAALAHMPAPFVFAAGAGTVVVWDVSTFGAGVTAELGHLPETRRLELIHAVVALAVGAVAIAGATGLYVLRTQGDVGVTVTAAMAVALVGAIVALLPLRG